MMAVPEGAKEPALRFVKTSSLCCLNVRVAATASPLSRPVWSEDWLDIHNHPPAIAAAMSTAARTNARLRADGAGGGSFFFCLKVFFFSMELPGQVLLAIIARPGFRPIGHLPRACLILTILRRDRWWAGLPGELILGLTDNLRHAFGDTGIEGGRSAGARGGQGSGWEATVLRTTKVDARTKGGRE